MKGLSALICSGVLNPKKPHQQKILSKKFGELKNLNLSLP
jgi:hypothetical protein